MPTQERKARRAGNARKLGACTLGLALLLLPGVASASGIDGADTAWILVSTALVLFMTIPGLALFYGGLVHSKNVLSVLMQCFVLTCADDRSCGSPTATAWPSIRLGHGGRRTTGLHSFIGDF